MTEPVDCFFIALPHVQSSLPRPRRSRPSEPSDAAWEDYPAYLRGAASLHNFLIHISGCRGLTRAEEDCVSEHVRRVAQQIREARTAWERNLSDVVDTL